MTNRKSHPLNDMLDAVFAETRNAIPGAPRRTASTAGENGPEHDANTPLSGERTVDASTSLDATIRENTAKLDRLVVNWRNAIADRATKTVQEMDRSIRELKAYADSNRVDPLSRSTLIAFRDHLALSRRLKPKTISKKLALIGAVLQLAFDDGHLAFNPAARIRVRKPNHALAGMEQTAHHWLRREPRQAHWVAKGLPGCGAEALGR